MRFTVLIVHLFGLFLVNNAWSEDISVLSTSDELKQQIALGYDLNKIDEFQQTPLMNAVYWNKIENARLLLEAGANVNKRNRYGRTAIIHAAIYGRLEIAKLLVRFGAYFDDKDYESYTTLHFASINGKVELVKYLISLGANVNNVNVKGKSILYSVQNTELQSYNRKRVTEILTENGAVEIYNKPTGNE